MGAGNRSTPPVSQGALASVNTFEEINAPGAWVSGNGMLMRVPEGALKSGHSPLVDVVSNETKGFTRISDDPYVAIGKARQLAANADLAVNF